MTITMLALDGGAKRLRDLPILKRPILHDSSNPPLRNMSNAGAGHGGKALYDGRLATARRWDLDGCKEWVRIDKPRIESRFPIPRSYEGRAVTLFGNVGTVCAPRPFVQQQQQTTTTVYLLRSYPPLDLNLDANEASSTLSARQLVSTQIAGDAEALHLTCFDARRFFIVAVVGWTRGRGDCVAGRSALPGSIGIGLSSWDCALVGDFEEMGRMDGGYWMDGWMKDEGWVVGSGTEP
ncbi:hypothetical protein SCHPADRAFT_896170 [Schizopora paradoxa]|uniref:Uncharacterized protein n=1 Tax=Schizopora paradoxa TaxID=27342 RepID=A0A0H2RL57_9AGAM|nr:hypothetical protein SCHPADRAFT_896170 [Schizopora paradoxa]